MLSSDLMLLQSHPTHLLTEEESSVDEILFSEEF